MAIFGAGSFLTLDWDPGWVKNQDPGSESGMNNPDHISESLETIFWAKILEFFGADPGSGREKIRIQDLGSGMENIWIRDKQPGSATLSMAKLV
jgi:hypothetical protein